jgi:hypothetical protein
MGGTKYPSSYGGVSKISMRASFITTLIIIIIISSSIIIIIQYRLEVVIIEVVSISIHVIERYACSAGLVGIARFAGECSSRIESFARTIPKFHHKASGALKGVL